MTDKLTDFLDLPLEADGSQVYASDWAEEMIPETANLTAREIALRERFVSELMIDHDYVKAAVRIGFYGEYAKQYSARFKYDEYVQTRYAEAMKAPYHEAESVEETQRQRVINMLFREAEFSGHGSSHSARVSAQAKLAALLGLEKPVESIVNNKGSVDLNVKTSFDFSTMDSDSLDLMRQLLVKQIPDDGN
jgi:hypothetical protein